MIWELLILGVVIGSNNFATALALGALGQAIKRWRVILVFGLFEFCIPLIGLWLGRRSAAAVADHAGWIGPALLAALGLWTLSAAWRSQRDAERLADRATTWTGLIMLSAGLSLDNLVVGFGLGLGDRDPLALATTIALFSTSFAWIGMRLGGFGRREFERSAEIGTGLLLIGLAAALAFGLL